MAVQAHADRQLPEEEVSQEPEPAPKGAGEGGDGQFMVSPVDGVYTMGNKTTRAVEKYRKDKVRQVIVRFYPSESELLGHLEKQDSMAGYIKELIREDIAKNSKDDTK